MAPSRSIMRKALLSSVLLAGLATSKEIKVKAGGSIQVAINGAVSGDTITVAKGTYPEQLTITRSGIQLVGQSGAVLIPPSSPVTNTCTNLTGTDPITHIVSQAGICISTGNVQLADFESEHRKVTHVTTYVENVLVKGFEIDSFHGLNIAIVGGKNTVVRENTLSDGTDYGILTVGSISTIITRNTIKSSDLNFIALCMDDTSDVSVTANTISDYKVGLCVETNKADVSHNTVSNCCVGAYVDPLVDAAHVTHNKITGSKDPRCVETFIAAGIVLDGATNTDVQHNDITGVTNPGVPDLPYPPPGIWLFDFTGPVGGDNTVDFNNLTNNDYNVLISSAGTGNEIKHNTCSNPSDNCNY